MMTDPMKPRALSCWQIAAHLGDNRDRQPKRRPRAEPGKLVSITDDLDATLPRSESFSTAEPAQAGTVRHGASFTPRPAGSPPGHCDEPFEGPPYGDPPQANSGRRGTRPLRRLIELHSGQCPGGRTRSAQPAAPRRQGGGAGA